jgi:hypothetical protein
VALESAPCSTLRVDAGVVDLALEGRIRREFVSGRSEPSKRWQGEGSCSSDRLGGSSKHGGSLRTSEAPGLPSAVRERVTRCSSRAERATDPDLKPAPFL